MAKGFDLYGKSDLRFLQGVYSVLRDLFHFQPRLTKEQFLSNGYAERKIILTYNLLLLCQARHKQLSDSSNSGSKGSKKFSVLSHTGGGPRNPPAVLTVQEGLEDGSAWSGHTHIHGNAFSYMILHYRK